MKIRFVEKKDISFVKKVIETSFPDGENKIITELVVDLFLETSTLPIKSLLAELDGEVAGYISFSPIFLSSESKISAYILCPLAVLPKYQKKGIGSSLINAGKQMLASDGVDALLVYGDPNYYGRFGFQHDTGSLFVSPHSLKYPTGWLGMALSQFEIGASPMKFSCVNALNKPELW